MKNYFKKFSITCILLLTILGVGAIHNGNIASAATIGQQLTQPENGWKRYDDGDSRIAYTDFSGIYSGHNKYQSCYNNTYTQFTSGTCKLKFYGTQIRIIGLRSSIGSGAYSDKINIKIDDSMSETFSSGGTVLYQTILYEKSGLTKGVHEINISNNYVGAYVNIDAIDIDETGYLANPDESISLNKSSMDLTVGDSQPLVASTTPAGAQVNWSSSDKSVATVDENGNVTGVKEGQVTITATINDGSNASATCTVNITPKASEPTEPQNPTGDGTLFIELVDGNIKSYDLSSQEITNFINWYKNRDLDDSQSPVYKFKKGNYTDYVVHDKIDWFEVR